MDKDKQQPSTLPLGRAFRLKELPGWIGKFLDVPVGRIGVCVQASGRGRTFSSGRHWLLTAVQRLRGQGIGMAAGYVIQGEFISLLKGPCLLSGDGELLDLDLTCTLGMVDAVKFFTDVVLPAGEIRATGLILDQEAAHNALNAVTTKYAAADLVHGIPPRLIGELHNSLSTLLGTQGVEIRNIQLVVFSRPEDRLKIAEKTQVLKERLSNVELQSKMAAIETQAQLNDFIQQLDPELQNVANFQMNSQDSGKSYTANKPGLEDTIRGWFGSKSNAEGGKGGRVANLLRTKKANEGPIVKPQRPRRHWWLPRTVWVSFVWIIAILLTVLINTLAKAASLNNRVELLLAIWGFAIFVTLESLKWLYEKREEIDETVWMLPGYQQLDSLVGNDRQRADELVREQSCKELLHIRDVLQEIRSREYKRGKTEMALKLRNEFEKHAEECAEKIGSADFGRPPYVTDLRISQHAWHHMLDYDEGLLIYANGLSDKVHLLQQKSHSDELDLPSLMSLDADIAAFSNQFFERCRPLEIPSQESSQ